MCRWVRALISETVWLYRAYRRHCEQRSTPAPYTPYRWADDPEVGWFRLEPDGYSYGEARPGDGD